MKPTELAKRAASAVSLPMAAVLLILFFTPWLSVHCEGPVSRKIGSATGLQLAMGDMTPAAGIEDPNQARELVETVKPRPWFYLGLMLPTGLILLALFGVIGRQRVGVGLTLLAIGGIVVVALAANVEYPELKEKMPTPTAAPRAAPRTPPGDPGEALGEAFGDMMMEGMQQGIGGAVQITTRTRPAWGWSLALYIILAVCGVADLLLPALVARLERRGPPPEGGPAAGAPPPPLPPA